MSAYTRREALKVVATGAAVGGLVAAGSERVEAEDPRWRRSGALPGIFQCEGRVDSHATRLAPAVFTGFACFKMRLSAHDLWNGAAITESSAWGEGKNGTDLWGWTGGAAVRHGHVLRDEFGYFFIYGLEQNVGVSRTITVNFRYVLRDGSHGVASAYFSYL